LGYLFVAGTKEGLSQGLKPFLVALGMSGLKPGPISGATAKARAKAEADFRGDDGEKGKGKSKYSRLGAEMGGGCRLLPQTIPHPVWRSRPPVEDGPPGVGEDDGCRDSESSAAGGVVGGEGGGSAG
jgi:hypothetical protein